MVLRGLLFVIMSVGLIGFGTVAWISTRPVEQPKVVEAAPARTAVLATAHSITAGNLLKPEDLIAKDVDTANVPLGALVDSPESRGSLVGSMVRHTLGMGDAVLPRDIMRPGDHGFLAAVLAPGTRAVTVSVDAVSGTAGLIWPGDKVDLILLQSRDDANLPIGQRVGAETVLSNVRVIAIDQHLVRGTAPDSAAPQGRDGGGRTATLEVSPEQAERVSVAASIGKLSLTVRSAESLPGDKAGDTAKTNGGNTVTWASDVSPVFNPGKKPAENTVVHVYQGGSSSGKSEEFKF